MPYKLVQVNSRHHAKWIPNHSDYCKQCNAHLNEGDLAAIKTGGKRQHSHYCEKCAKILHLV